MSNIEEVKLGRRKKDIANVIILQDDNASKRDKEKAFNTLYSKYNEKIKFYFLKKLKDKDAIEDLLIVTFEKVHKSIKTFNKDSGAFSTWLFAIARNTLIDYSRRANYEVLSLDALVSRTLADNNGLKFQIASTVKDPEENFVSEEVKKAVNKAINSIESDVIRNIMICRFIEELSFEEIAEELGLTFNSSLRVMAGRGKKMVMKSLEEFKY